VKQQPRQGVDQGQAICPRVFGSLSGSPNIGVIRCEFRNDRALGTATTPSNDFRNGIEVEREGRPTSIGVIRTGQIDLEAEKTLLGI
jgi:hypothetical protein